MSDGSVDEAGGRFPVSNHHDLFHIFALRLQDTSCQPQTFRGIRVIRPHLRGGEFRQRQFFGAVVKQNDLQRVARILRANQVAESQRDFLGRRKTIFAVQNHRMRAIQHHYRGA